MRPLLGLAIAGAAACSATAWAAQPPPTAYRGEAFAVRACAGCHAIGRAGESPNPHAPPFRDVAAGRSRAQIVQALGRISREGHAEMPPVYVTPSEIRQLAAYIRLLAGHAV